MSVLIIAEAGVNHNGDRQMAFDLVDAAVEAKADVIKFQTFKAEDLVTVSAAKADYQKKATGSNESQLAMLKQLELSSELHYELLSYCQQKGIRFLSTAFDHKSLDFLVQDLGVGMLKISSGELTNGPLLLAHAQTGKKMILSTGMATLDEIEEALGVLAFGLTGMEEPSRAKFRRAFSSKRGKQALKDNVQLLHCTTQYPTKLVDIHLSAMQSLKDCFGLGVGYSDHSEGILVPIMAATLGAEIIEKHITLNRSLPGPDHKASLEPDELKDMVRSVRMVDKVLGTGEKNPTEDELQNSRVARKSLVANMKIEIGEAFTRDNIAVKRPGTGKTPMEFWDILGTICKKSYDADEVII